MGLSRLVLLLFSAVFIVSLVVAGVMVLLLTILWSLLRGKKPAVFQIYSQFCEASKRFRGTGFQSHPAAEQPKDIVDVNAREVDEADKLKFLQKP